MRAYPRKINGIDVTQDCCENSDCTCNRPIPLTWRRRFACPFGYQGRRAADPPPLLGYVAYKARLPFGWPVLVPSPTYELAPHNTAGLPARKLRMVRGC